MKVSVVVPAFNAEKFLEECLSSVKNQTFVTLPLWFPVSPVELITVNDGSTDMTQQIAEKYATLACKEEVNRGIGYTRQVASKIAMGDHVAFLSADDAYHPYFLELMMRSADGKSILFSDYWRCDEKLNPKSVFLAPRFKTQKQFRKLVVEWIVEQKGNMFTNFSTVIIPKYVFNIVQFDESLRYGEDLVFLLETVCAGIPWKHIDLPLVYYRVHSEAGTEKWKQKRNWMLREKMWRRVTPLLCELGVNHKQILRLRRSDYRKRMIPQPVKTVYKKLRKAIV